MKVTYLGLEVKEATIMDDVSKYCKRHAFITFEGGQTAMVDAKDLLIGRTEMVDIRLSNGDFIRVRCS